MILDWIDWATVSHIAVGSVLGYWAAVGRQRLDQELRKQREIADRTLKEVREVSDYVHERDGEQDHADVPAPVGQPGERGPKGDQGDVGEEYSSFRKWAIGIVVFLTAFAAIASGVFAAEAKDRLNQADHRSKETKAAQVKLEADQKQLDQDQADFDAQVACQNNLLSETILALKARSTFAEQQAAVTLELSRAQRTFLHTDPNSPMPVRLRAFQDYLVALDNSIVAIRDQLKVRDDNPFPSVKRVKSCRS